jgi:hypothetical protein
MFKKYSRIRVFIIGVAILLLTILITPAAAGAPARRALFDSQRYDGPAARSAVDPAYAGRAGQHL